MVSAGQCRQQLPCFGGRCCFERVRCWVWGAARPGEGVGRDLTTPQGYMPVVQWNIPLTPSRGGVRGSITLPGTCLWRI